MKDWLKRTLKTFVQTFGGVVLTGVAYILANVSTFESMAAIWKYLFPVICAGASAGICAAWNIPLEKNALNAKAENAYHDLTGNEVK